jgi:hypothetical protein
MASVAINPLTAADLALAQQILIDGQQLLAYYQKCTNCGLNAANLAAQAQSYIDFANSVIAEFGSAPSSGGV